MGVMGVRNQTLPFVIITSLPFQGLLLTFLLHQLLLGQQNLLMLFLHFIDVAGLVVEHFGVLLNFTGSLCRNFFGDLLVLILEISLVGIQKGIVLCLSPFWETILL